MNEMSVEDELRNELRDVRHDLEHVTRERDAAKKRSTQLLGRIARVRRVRDGIPCANCEHAAEHHDEGPCDVHMPELGRACRCSWGPGDIAESIDAALEEQK